MKHHSTLAALAAPPLVACASAPNAGDEALAAGGVAEPTQVAVYYVGQAPKCGMKRLTEVQGISMEQLQWSAWQLRANAVIGVRSRLMVVEQPRGIYRRAIVGPSTVRVFQGMAVRMAERCTV